MHKFSPHDAFKNYLLEGNSISVFEAMVLFAVQSPRGDILRLKREGFLIGKRRIPMVQVLARLNLCLTFLALGYFLVLCFNIASNLTFIIIPTCHILLCGYFLVL